MSIGPVTLAVAFSTRAFYSENETCFRVLASFASLS